MARSRYKMWRNGPGGRWSARIIWFHVRPGEDMRLSLEDCERRVNVYPKSVEEAEHIWFMFRHGAPKDGEKIPFVSDLLAILKKGEK